MAIVTLDAFDNIDLALGQAGNLLEALLMLIDDFDGSSQQQGTAPMRCVADVVSEKIAEAEKILDTRRKWLAPPSQETPADALEHVEYILIQARGLLEALHTLIDEFDGSSRQQGTDSLLSVLDSVCDKIDEVGKILEIRGWLTGLSEETPATRTQSAPKAGKPRRSRGEDGPRRAAGGGPAASASKAVKPRRQASPV
jgi:hypothetical protein